MNHTERSQILQMVENGQISVQDAIGMMAPKSQDQDIIVAQSTQDNRWLRIRVTNLETGNGKVNVNLPLSWMKFGLSMGSRFVPELDDLDIDEMVMALDEIAQGCIVQVEDAEDNQRVEIYIE